MGERKRIETLLMKAREKVEKADRLFEASRMIYISLSEPLHREIEELENIIKENSLVK